MKLFVPKLKKKKKRFGGDMFVDLMCLQGWTKSRMSSGDRPKHIFKILLEFIVLFLFQMYKLHMFAGLTSILIIQHLPNEKNFLTEPPQIRSMEFNLARP